MQYVYVIVMHVVRIVAFRCVGEEGGEREGERERAKPRINRNSHTIVEIYKHVLLAGGMRLLSEERRYSHSFVRLETRVPHNCVRSFHVIALRH